MSEFAYVGNELDLFSMAQNWKAYWSARVRPFIRGDVVEVGAGIGANTRLLDSGGGAWMCLEPDHRLIRQLAAHLGGAERYEIVCGTLQDLEERRKFDTIIYIDVVEHIQDDRSELKLAASRLRLDGRIILLCPAHQQLYTPFDEAIGHFRRYNRRSLREIGPSGMRLERVEYLDSVGLAASLANRLLLRQSMPTRGQIQLWDQLMVPVSRMLDGLLFHRAGKSIVAVWKKESER